MNFPERKNVSLLSHIIAVTMCVSDVNEHILAHIQLRLIINRYNVKKFTVEFPKLGNTVGPRDAAGEVTSLPYHAGMCDDP